MQFFLYITIFNYIYLTDFLNVKSVSLTNNYITITSDQGILIYDVLERKIKASFPANNPRLAVLSPDLTKVFFIEDSSTFTIYSILAETNIIRKTLDFSPKILGVGLRSVFLKNQEKILYVDYSGFNIPEMEKEDIYIQSSELLTAPSIPSILNEKGERITPSCIFFDSLRNLIFVGTRGFGVLIFEKNKLSYTDTIALGFSISAPMDSIRDFAIWKDTLFILTSEAIFKIDDNLHTRRIPRPLSAKYFTDMCLDTSIYILDSSGKVYEYTGDNFITLFSLESQHPFKKIVASHGLFLSFSTNELFLITNTGSSNNVRKITIEPEIDDAVILDSAIAVLSQGKIFLITPSGISQLSDSTTLFENIISMTKIQGMLWAVTPSYLFNINPSYTLYKKLMVSNPVKVTNLRDLPAVLYQDFLVLYEDSTFILRSIPSRIIKVRDVARWNNMTLFIGPRALVLEDRW
ncbi:MAG: hypothetical protein ACPLN0_05270 [Candidatus Hydrothermia bacterium]